MESLEKKLGYTFRDRSLLSEALNTAPMPTSTGARGQQQRAAGVPGRQRAGLCDGGVLFKTYGKLPEGDLTRIRAALVCEQSLYEVAKFLGLGQYLKLGKGEEAGGGASAQSILADATEAVFAAVYWTAAWSVSGSLSAGCSSAGPPRRRGAPGLQDHPAGDRPAQERPGADLPHGDESGPDHTRPSCFRSGSTARRWARAGVTARRSGAGRRQGRSGEASRAVSLPEDRRV